MQIIIMIILLSILVISNNEKPYELYIKHSISYNIKIELKMNVTGQK